MAKKPPLYPHIPKSRGPNSSLPTKAEMDELDKLFDQANSILIRWRLKMTSPERTEWPTVSREIDKAEKALSDIADALYGISTELGFGPLRQT